MGWLKGFTVVAAVALVWPAQAQEITCHAPGKAMLRTELWFGRNIGSKLDMSEKLWRQFVARDLTPRFPDGLTVVEAHGQWRDSKSGARVREPSKIVVLVTADDAATRERITAAADAYKKRFKQDSVATVTRPVCATF